jgi:hypothetical protein
MEIIIETLKICNLPLQVTVVACFGIDLKKFLSVTLVTLRRIMNDKLTTSDEL